MFPLQKLPHCSVLKNPKKCNFSKPHAHCHAKEALKINWACRVKPLYNQLYSNLLLHYFPIFRVLCTASVWTSILIVLCHHRTDYDNLIFGNHYAIYGIPSIVRYSTCVEIIMGRNQDESTCTLLKYLKKTAYILANSYWKARNQLFSTEWQQSL